MFSDIMGLDRFNITGSTNKKVAHIIRNGKLNQAYTLQREKWQQKSIKFNCKHKETRITMNEKMGSVQFHIAWNEIRDHNTTQQWAMIM